MWDVKSQVKTVVSFFCSELLLNKHVEYFQSWMYHLSHELILHSIRNPLVSGFYKLLSVTMKIAKRIKYYQVIFPLIQSIICHPIYCICHRTGLCRGTLPMDLVGGISNCVFHLVLLIKCSSAFFFIAYLEHLIKGILYQGGGYETRWTKRMNVL